MGKKQINLNVRIDDEISDELEIVCSSVNLSKSKLIRNVIEAICDSYKQNGSISIPIKIKYDDPNLPPTNVLDIQNSEELRQLRIINDIEKDLPEGDKEAIVTYSDEYIKKIEEDLSNLQNSINKYTKVVSTLKPKEDE